MPQRDGTGPDGRGRRSGGGRGPCAQTNQPAPPQGRGGKRVNRGSGQGMGRRGGGQGQGSGSGRGRGGGSGRGRNR